METEQIMSAIFLIAVLILILLFVDKKPGKIKIRTAIRNIADIIWSVSILIMFFSRTF